MAKNRVDEKSVRNALIWAERKDGVPPTDIAKKYNLSEPRIHRICLKEENKELKLRVRELEAKLEEKERNEQI